MNAGFRFHHVTPVIAGMLLIACSSSPISRIDANRDAYDSWPVDIKSAVLNERVIKGMTPEQVETAWGKPTEIVSRASQAGIDEVWIYRKGGGASGVLKNTGLVLGTGIGGVNVGTGIGGGGSSTVTEENEVVFNDGVVVRVRDG